MSDITKVPISRIDGLEDIANGNFVKKSGDTMTGNLEISHNNPLLDLKNTALESGVTPTDEVSTAVRFLDKNNVVVGYVDHDCLPDGRAMSRLNSRNMDASKEVSLTVGYTAEDVAYTSSPQINITNTSETPREVLVVRDTVLDAAATTSAVATGGYITTRDANNRIITRIYSASIPTGPSNICAIQAWNADTSFESSLGIKVDKTGSYGEGVCPTPRADSNGAVIATTAWVRNLAADKNLSNLSDTGKQLISNLGTPNMSTGVGFSSGAVMPYDVLVVVKGTYGGYGTGFLYVDGQCVLALVNNEGSGRLHCGNCIVKKGSTVTFSNFSAAIHYKLG